MRAALLFALLWGSVASAQVTHSPFILSVASGGSGFGTSAWPDYSARADWIIDNLSPTFICNNTLDDTGSFSGSNWSYQPSLSHGCVYPGTSKFLIGNGSAGFVAASSAVGDTLPGVTNVFEINNATSTASSHHQQLDFAHGTDPTDKTWCIRNYEMHETNFEIPVGSTCGSQPCDQKWKNFREHSGNDGSINTDAERNHPGFETSSVNACNGSNANTCTEQWDYGAFNGSAFGNPSTSWSAHGQVSLAELRGKWWRREVCWDHTASTGTLVGRGRMFRLSDGLTVTNTATYPNSGVSTIGFTISSGGNANYPNDLDSPNWIGGSNRRRYASSSMVVVVDRDPTFEIGPDCEIEGGLNGVPSCP